MRINLPNLSGLREIPSEMKEVVKYVVDFGEYIRSFTSKGIIPAENVSCESLTITNPSINPEWVEVEHGLGRTPLFFAVQSGGPAYILDSRLGMRTVQFLLSGGATLRIVIQ